ncbi:Inhibitor of growth protein 4 [Varanus komodoensis]|nr:Inhibitor of growth protein 4 [Varanus komodoensis]
MTPVLRQLHWLPIEVRAQFKVLVMTYKALNGLGPGYLKERLHPYMSAHPLRSVGEALLREPSMKEIRRVEGRAQKEKKAARARSKGKNSDEEAPKTAQKKLKLVRMSTEYGMPSVTFGNVHPSDVLDMPVDPNEPTYCLCHQVSYGEMIGCDNPDCSIEWFHFACVGLTTKPRGKCNLELDLEANQQLPKIFSSLKHVAGSEVEFMTDEDDEQ